MAEGISSSPARRCDFLILLGRHEAVLVVRLGVGAVAGSTAEGEHRDEGHGTSRASRLTGLQRADAGQELDQRADVGGWVLAVAGMHEVVLVAGLGVGAVAGSTAAGEHQAEGHGTSRASRSTVLQRADAGQELDG